MSESKPATFSDVSIYFLILLALIFVFGAATLRQLTHIEQKCSQGQAQK